MPPKILIAQLSNFFKMRSERLTTIANLIIGLLQNANVNLSSLASYLPGKTLLESRIKTLYRFFKNQEICHIACAKFIAANLPKERWKLVIDRTNWKFGKIYHNILTLAIIQNGIAVPILVKMLDNKGGNSTDEQKIELIDQFVNIFGVEKIEYIIGDREFIGEKWLSWLHNQEIRFMMRIKENAKISPSNNCDKNYKNLEIGEKRSFQADVAGIKIFISIKKLEDGFLILAHNFKTNDAFAIYSERWDIECGFKAMKSNGFELEKTHFIHEIRLKKLFLICAMATSVAVKSGKLFNEKIPIKLRNKNSILTIESIPIKRVKKNSNYIHFFVMDE